MPATALEKAIAERNKGEMLLNNIAGRLKTAKTNLTIHQVELFIQEAERAWTTIDEAHIRIIAAEPEKSNDHILTLNSLFNSYVDSVSSLKALKAALTPQPGQGPTTSPHAEIKLPKINLPTFSGEVHEWISFRDMYVTAVHNNMELSDAQKFTYLKSSLIGNAAKIIKSLTISDANYSVAWDTVTERYENKRELYFAIMKRFTSSLPSLTTSNATSLRSIVDMTMECTRAIDTLKITDKWDAILLYLITQKLDPTSKEHWELSLSNTEIPESKDLIAFIKQRARSLAASSSGTSSQMKDLHPKRMSLQARTESTPSAGNCSFCSGSHFNYRCPKFNALRVNERKALVEKSKTCFNCLRSGHRVKDCPLEKGCKSCGRKHHSLLHSETVDSQSNDQPATGNQPTGSHAQSSQAQNFHSQDTYSKYDSMLATAVIRVKTAQGGSLPFRALLDGGSTVSCISEACIGQLGLRRERDDTEVVGLGSVRIGRSRGIAQVNFKPHFDSKKLERFCIDAYVLKKITSQLPSKKYDTSNWRHITRLQLADPAFNVPAEVDILLGADVFFKILLNGKRAGTSMSPVAINSKLGWLVSGPTGRQPPKIKIYHTLSLEENLERFWEVEQVPKKKAMTEEERSCEADFQKNYHRDSTGRFVVRMPMKQPAVPLGSSYPTTKKRFLQVEAKLQSRTEVKTLYQTFMEQYETLGHMSKTNQEPSAGKVYIPHHYILKDWNRVNKFRVVFDASAKTSSGFSLNDAQLIGPVVQDSLYTILMRFRIHRVAFTADISKMYRQILIAPEQRHLQCILWRSEPDQPIQEFQLLTVTYGTASAPFLATRVLQELASLGATDYPLGADITRRDFYMDDVMSGKESVETSVKAISQLRQLLYSAGFTLSKFASNHVECLKEIPMELRETKDILSMEDLSVVRALGLYWNTTTDQFLFKVNVPVYQSRITKRNLLAEISKIFDPMGWLAPIIIRTKILMQQVWKEKISWDDYPTASVQLQWEEFQTTIKQIQNIHIDRWIYTSPTHCTIELHGFSDASEKAYAGVVYMKTEDQDGNIYVSLLTAKTKVAPIAKAMTIPRLELCGALLLADLMAATQESLGLSVNDMKAWTDSTIVLGWIKSCPSRWKTFVANRVARIQESIPSLQWGHIPGCENPADIASRGIAVANLVNHKLWWKGPSWLADKESVPNEIGQLSTACSEEGLEEEAKRTVVVSTTQTGDNSIFARYSTLLRLRRIIAWIRRFINNTLSRHRKKINPQSLISTMIGPLQSQELEAALRTLITIAQGTTFANEIAALKDGTPLTNTSKILCLRPELDTNGILRVGGRLKHANITSAMKHPIILPRHHRLTELLIQEAHVQHFHAGAQMVQGILSLNYWIIRSRDAIRFQIRKCVTCTRHRASTVTQLMGDLPKSRVQYSRAFLKTGVDYAGPFLLRPISRSKTTYKAYLALFVCFVTRALHLEIVSSQTTDAFIAALRRFTSRRGKPIEIYSDCGTNFVGAARELKEFAQIIQSEHHNEAVTNHLSGQGIQWHFNPAGAPHFGGLWEAGVKSVKHHLHRVVGSTRLTYEEFATIITQIEGSLNSRPLTPLSSDPNDLEVLTPAHFLIGESLQSIPDPDLGHLPTNRLNRWQLLQKLKQDVHRRWLREYISRLQQRPKWMTQQRNIQIGDMVLVKSDIEPSARWPLARVIQIHPGQDGCTRVVTLRTSKGEIKRPIVKLCLLPFDTEDT